MPEAETSAQGQRRTQITLRPDHTELAAYLLAREATQKPSDKADVRRLIDCNESVHETRALLRYGRGNVNADVQQTNREGFLRAKMLQTVRQELALDPINSHTNPLATRHVLHAAGSMVIKAANCDGHAALVAHLHAPKLKQGESLVLVGTTEIPHAWCELRKQGHPTVVLDPWAEGPPKFADDVALTANKVYGSIDLSNRERLAKQRQQNIDKLRSPSQTATMTRKLEDLDQHYRDEKALDGETFFAPTNFTSPTLAKGAREALPREEFSSNCEQASKILRTDFGIDAEGAKVVAPHVVTLARHLRDVPPRTLPCDPPPLP